MAERFAVYISALVFLWSVAKQYRPPPVSETWTRVLACWKQAARSRSSRGQVSARPVDAGRPVTRDRARPADQAVRPQSAKGLFACADAGRGPKCLNRLSLLDQC